MSMTTEIDGWTPFARSYWVEPGRFLAGCYPGDLDPLAAAAKAKALVQVGVTRCISLMEADERDHGGRRFQDYADTVSAIAARLGRTMAFARFEVRDAAVPTPERMRAVLDAIDRELAAGGCVYLHCWGGRGRTGTVVACWLIRHGYADRETALARLQTLTEPAARHFRPTPDTTEQEAFVRAWTETARGVD